MARYDNWIDGLNDGEALVYIVETNLMQRSFSDMTHSENTSSDSPEEKRLFIGNPITFW